MRIYSRQSIIDQRYTGSMIDSTRKSYSRFLSSRKCDAFLTNFRHEETEYNQGLEVRRVGPSSH
jgi:hypothetical protein